MPIEKGTQEIIFNAANLLSGVYFYRMDATAFEGDNDLFLRRHK